MLKILFLIFIFINIIHAEKWWHFKVNSVTKYEIDYNIIKNHSNCNCTGINFNKSLIEIKSSQFKVNKKFLKLFNKFLK